MGLGHPVIYRAHEDHHVTTRRTDGEGDDAREVEVHGSVHHPELREFAGLVTRVHADGRKFDVVIFPPNREPRHVDGVAEGTNDHEIEFV